LDYAGLLAHVRRSRHLNEYGEPKTRAARRTIELFPASVALLRSIRPLHVTPDTPVFTNVLGRPLDQQAFTRHWYECLRSLGIRQRGIYCTKDTFVSTSLAAGVNIRWLEQQTGENYETLKKHYSRWMPLEVGSELRRFASVEPALFEAQIVSRRTRRRGTILVTSRNYKRKAMVPRGFEPLLPT
jgi:integrase